MNSKPEQTKSPDLSRSNNDTHIDTCIDTDTDTGQDKASTARRRVLGSAAVLGLVAGGLYSWYRNTPSSPSPQELQQLWATNYQHPNGEDVNWSQFKGKPLIINFWATWCAPCVEEMPLIDRFYKENASNGWQVLGLAIDQPSRVKSFLTQTPVSYPIVLAGLGGTELSQTLGNKSGALPFTIILSANERVLLKKIGKLKAEELSSLL